MIEKEYINVANYACLSSVIDALDVTIGLEDNPEFVEAKKLLFKVLDEIKIEIEGDE